MGKDVPEKVPATIEPCLLRKVTGGRLGKGKSITIEVKQVLGREFWTINATDAQVCKLLTGRAGCYRPLTGVQVYKDLRAAIASSREGSDESDNLVPAPAEKLWEEPSPQKPRNKSKRHKDYSITLFVGCRQE
jgi:hypothetical protein